MLFLLFLYIFFLTKKKNLMKILITLSELNNLFLYNHIKNKKKIKIKNVLIPFF